MLKKRERIFSRLSQKINKIENEILNKIIINIYLFDKNIFFSFDFLHFCKNDVPLILLSAQLQFEKRVVIKRGGGDEVKREVGKED